MRYVAILLGLAPLVVGAVATLAVVHGDPVTPPMFRRVRLVNASNASVARLLVVD